MSEFLERNKRKGAVAGLLLLLKRGKGAGPVMLMASLLAVVFVLPSGMRSRLGEWLGFDRDGMRSSGEGGDVTPFAEMDEAARRARAGELRRGSSLPGGGNMAYYGRSTVNYVKGEDPSKLKEKSALEAIGRGGKDVDGVLRPDDAKKMAEGVQLDPKEFEDGLLKNAFAGGFGGSGGVGSSGGPGASGGAFLNRPRGADRQTELRNATMNGATNVPGSGAPVSRGGDRRKLQWRLFDSLTKRVGSSLRGLQNANKNTAMYDLVQGRAYSVAAAPPPGFCGDNCPREFASNTGGAVFDGGRIGDSILSAEALGDPGVPVTPDASQIQPLLDKAKGLEEDVEKCKQAAQNPTYGKNAQQQKMDEMQAHADKLNGMCCDCGGCSASKARACQAEGDKMRATCNQLNSLMAAEHRNCPLRTGSAPKEDCNQ